MRSDSGGTRSSWMKTAEVERFGALTEDAEADVVVVGGGIAGLTVAYLLMKAGETVVLLEDGDLGSGETGRTTAHLSNALDDRYTELIRVFGEDGARLAAASHAAAIDKIEKIASEASIDCDFERVDGYLFEPPGEPARRLAEELDAAHRAGLTDVERVDRSPIPSFDTGPALRFPRQAQFHPLKYLDGLARAVAAGGGRIFTGTHAAEISGGERATAKTSDGRTATAKAVVVATNSPVNDMFAMHTKQASYRSYAIALEVARDVIPAALFWDDADPYHYARVQRGEGDGDLLIVGGEDHKTGQADETDERFGRLESWTRERFPEADEVTARWSGQVLEPVDSLAFIGRNPGDDNVYVVTGDSGHGLTHATIAGILITDLILGRKSPWEDIYSPSRVSASTATEFAKENANVAAQYLDLVTPGEISDAEDVAPGHGAVVRRGLSKVAVFRDDDGTVHECSAICPHLGCVVAWNGTERSWDCPCHGSRFDAFGHVVNGPANTDLASVESKQEA